MNYFSRPRERCLFGLCIHPDDAKQLEVLMQRPEGKSPQSIINNNAYVDKDFSDNESDTNSLHARALATRKSYEADHITVDIENDVPEGQFFDKYEFDDYETDDYEVVNFEINSPDIEAFEGLDSSSQSAFQERLIF